MRRLTGSHRRGREKQRAADPGLGGGSDREGLSPWTVIGCGTRGCRWSRSGRRCGPPVSVGQPNHAGRFRAAAGPGATRSATAAARGAAPRLSRPRRLRRPPPRRTPIRRRPPSTRLRQSAAGPKPRPGLPSAATNLGTQTGGRAETNSVNPVAASVNLAGGQAAPVLNAPDLGELLSKSPSAAGVEVQRRNAVSSDPRIRGYRVGQFDTLGDDALFFPARQDLDTAVAKFDPGSVRDIVIVKGPYQRPVRPRVRLPRHRHPRLAAVRLLPGPRPDVARLPDQRRPVGRLAVRLRRRQGMGLPRHRTNGLTGNDYRAGNRPGHRRRATTPTTSTTPSALNLTDNSKLEFKGLVVHQQNVQFPGLYFDIKNLNTAGVQPPVHPRQPGRTSTS